MSTAVTPISILLRVLRRPVASGATPTLEAKLAAAEALEVPDLRHDDDVRVITNDDVRVIAEIAQGPVDARLQVRAAILLRRWGVETLPALRDPLTYGASPAPYVPLPGIVADVSSVPRESL